jgi:hypothetical protein
VTDLPQIAIVQGATRPAWVVTFKFDDDSALNLTGASYAGVLRRMDGGTSKSTAGSYATTTAASGIFTYTPHADDVSEMGTWTWETTITISSQPYKCQVELVLAEKYAA